MEKNKYTFFWKDQSPFSQWNKAGFTLDGIHFKRAEHYMMWKKAMMFGDTESAEKILKSDHPRDAKHLGRAVKGFVKKDWEENCKKIVYDGNHAKFTQNPILLKQLMDTAGTTLVEASPYDKIWGIGLTKEEARRIPENKWPGTNWLGLILTQLRDNLLLDRSNP